MRLLHPSTHLALSNSVIAGLVLMLAVMVIVIVRSRVGRRG